MRYVLTLLSVFILGCSGPSAFGNGEMGAPSEALISIDKPVAWSVGIRYCMSRRAFQTGITATDFDITHAVARVGYSILPSIHASAELGQSRAQRKDRDGERGLEYSAGIDINLLEHVIHSSPVVGRKKSLTAGVTAEYRRSESNFTDLDFHWEEISTSPFIAYVVNHKGDALWHPYAPTGTRVTGGLVFSHVDGKYGLGDLEGTRDFGATMGAAFRFTSGWIAEFDTTLLGDNDRSVSLGVSYYF